MPYSHRPMRKPFRKTQRMLVEDTSQLRLRRGLFQAVGWWWQDAGAVTQPDWWTHQMIEEEKKHLYK